MTNTPQFFIIRLHHCGFWIRLHVLSYGSKNRNLSVTALEFGSPYFPFFFFFPIFTPHSCSQECPASLWCQTKLTIKRNSQLELRRKCNQAAKVFPSCPVWKSFLLLAETLTFCTLVQLYGVSNREQSLGRRSPEMVHLSAHAPVMFVAELQGIMACQEKYVFFFFVCREFQLCTSRGYLSYLFFSLKLFYS